MFLFYCILIAQHSFNLLLVAKCTSCGSATSNSSAIRDTRL